MKADDAELRAQYARENRQLCVRGARTVALICLLLFPIFWWLDASRFPGSGTLVTLRLIFGIAPLGVLGLLLTSTGQRHPIAVTIGSSMLGAAVTTALMDFTGGHASPYFGGIGLAMLLAALVMPWRPVWTWLCCVLLIATYLLCSELLDLQGGAEALRSNLVSYAATMVVAGLATVSRERLRWREFVARRALERSQAQLNAEVDVLRALARAGREMLRVSDAPRILERLCRLTTEVLDCDVSHTIVCDDERRVWRAIAQHGNAPAHWEAIRHVEVPFSRTVQIADRLREHGIVQLAAAEIDVPGGPLHVAARTGITRSMFVPLYSGVDLVGIQTAGYRGRREPFTATQERVAMGMAQLASLALANAKLHGELVRQTEAERAARGTAELANRAKDDFLATLSHELRTPLNLILGYLEMLGDDGVAAPERKLILERATLASRQLFFMITDTLEISRLHAGQLGAQLAGVSLRELWAELRAECEKLPRRTTTALVWDDEVDDLEIRSDRRMLLVIVRNLVGNALKFTPAGSVRVSASLGDGALTVRVADTGIGIPEEARAKIFEMFQQVDGT
ncbi:MAG: histidine kinase dimerization/phospho-acceptor domain-containing protein, partial [Thermodesulfobacteriota bacterium]